MTTITELLRTMQKIGYSGTNCARQFSPWFSCSRRPGRHGLSLALTLAAPCWRRVGERSVGIDQCGRRRTQSDPRRGQIHAAVSADRGLAASSDQSGKELGRPPARKLQPDSESDALARQQRDLACLTTVGAGAAVSQPESDCANVGRIHRSLWSCSRADRRIARRC